MLAPSRDPAVDESRVSGRAFLGSEPETLGDAGTESFDEGVRAFDETQHGLDSVGVLEIDRDAPADSG